MISLIFLYEHFVVKLLQFHVVSHVVEVDRHGILIQKIYALYANLGHFCLVLAL